MKTNLIKKIFLALYVALIFGFSIFSKAEGLGFATQEPRHYQGEVVQTLDGNYYLILEDETFFLLQSEQNLEPFNGWNVEITGYEVSSYKVGPVFSVSSMDPLPEETKKNVAAPVFRVMSINGISQVE